MLNKLFTCFLVAIVLISCKDSSSSKSSQTNKDSSASGSNVNSSNTNSVGTFEDFQQAIASKDKAKVKSFFKFPFTGDNNQIWFYVAKTDTDRDNIPWDAKAFTDQDFDKHFDTLFTSMFSNSLAKINPTVLADKGESNSGDLMDGTTKYFMNVFHEKEAKTINLHLRITTAEKDETGKDIGTHTSNVLYIFLITPSGALQFKQLTTPDAA